MKKEIKAIYNEDLKVFLEKVNEFEDITNGNRFCKICGIPINLNNIQMVIPVKNRPFEYICESTYCIEKFHENK